MATHPCHAELGSRRNLHRACGVRRATQTFPSEEGKCPQKPLNKHLRIMPGSPSGFNTLHIILRRAGFGAAENKKSCFAGFQQQHDHAFSLGLRGIALGGGGGTIALVVFCMIPISYGLLLVPDMRTLKIAHAG